MTKLTDRQQESKEKILALVNTLALVSLTPEKKEEFFEELCDEVDYFNRGAEPVACDHEYNDNGMCEFCGEVRDWDPLDHETDDDAVTQLSL